MCILNAYPVPGHLGFSGYAAADLDTVYINGDTVCLSGLTDTAGAIYQDGNLASFHDLVNGHSYHVVVPSLNRSYEITHLEYGNLVFTYSAYSCKDPGIVHALDSATVDGNVIPAINVSVNNSCILLPF